MRIILFLASLVFLVWGVLFFQEIDPVSEKPNVLVSIQPYSYIIERLAGDFVETAVLVPPGADAHTFEPTLKQVQKTTHTQLWFRIGDIFETKFSETLKHYSPKTKIIDLHTDLPLIMGAHEDFCCPDAHKHEHHGSHAHDPHIWLSLRMMQFQVESITNALLDLLPNHKDELLKRKAVFLQELKELDEELVALLFDKAGRYVLVSHPAYAYFCRDYGIQQMTLEMDGREPSPQQVTALVKKVKEEGINTLFVQKQYYSKAVRVLSEQLDLELIWLDPYAMDYLNNLRKVGRAFAGEEL